MEVKNQRANKNPLRRIKEEVLLKACLALGLRLFCFPQPSLSPILSVFAQEFLKTDPDEYSKYHRIHPFAENCLGEIQT